jgi:hypothetical protein
LNTTTQGNHNTAVVSNCCIVAEVRPAPACRRTTEATLSQHGY